MIVRLYIHCICKLKVLLKQGKNFSNSNVQVNMTLSYKLQSYWPVFDVPTWHLIIDLYIVCMQEGI